MLPSLGSIRNPRNSKFPRFSASFPSRKFRVGNLFLQVLKNFTIVSQSMNIRGDHIQLNIVQDSLAGLSNLFFFLFVPAARAYLGASQHIFKVLSIDGRTRTFGGMTRDESTGLTCVIAEQGSVSESAFRVLEIYHHNLRHGQDHNRLQQTFKLAKELLQYFYSYLDEFSYDFLSLGRRGVHCDNKNWLSLCGHIFDLL